MKTKLYRKVVKSICKFLGTTRKQFFARDFRSVVTHVYYFNIETGKTELDNDRLMIVDQYHPLSTASEAADLHIVLFMKYWRHSHWKPIVQMKIDLGMPEKKAIIEVLEARKAKKRTIQTWTIS